MYLTRQLMVIFIGLIIIIFAPSNTQLVRPVVAQDCDFSQRDFYGNCITDQGGGFFGSQQDCPFNQRDFFGNCITDQQNCPSNQTDFFGNCITDPSQSGNSPGVIFNGLGENLSCENFDTIFTSLSTLSLVGGFGNSGQFDSKTIEKMLLPFGAQFCFMQRQYDRAIALYDRAMKLYQKDGLSVAEAMILNDMGAAYLGKGEYDSALLHFQQSLDLIKAMPEYRGVPITNIGLIYTYQGRFVEAQEYYARALEDKQFKDNNIWMAINHLDTGLSYHLQADSQTKLDVSQVFLDRARSEYMAALDLLHSNGSGGLLGSLGGAGLLSNETQLGGKSSFDIESILPIFETLSKMGTPENQRNAKLFLSILRGGNPALEAAAQYNLAILDLEAKNYDSARAKFEEVLGIAQVLGDSSFEGTVLTLVGFSYFLEKRNDEALTAYNTAIETLSSGGGGDPLVIAYANRGLLFESMKRTSDAIKDYQQSITLVENGLNRVVLDSTISNLATLLAYTPPYQRMTALMVANKDTAAALNYTERGRAVLTRTQLLSDAIDYHKLSNSTLLEQERALRQQLRDAQVAVDNLGVLKEATQEQLTAAKNKLEAAQIAYLNHIQQMQLEGGYLEREVSRDVAETSAVEKSVPPNTALIVYKFGAINPSGMGVFDNPSTAFVVTNRDIKPISLSFNSQSVQQLVKTYIADPKSQTGLLQEIYELVFTDVVKHIPSHTTHLIIAPDGLLNYVPFAALPFPDGKYLIDHYSISMIPSGTILTILEGRKPQVATKPGLVLVQPVATGLPILPNAGTEAQSAARALGVKPISDATEADLRDNVSGAAVVHISAHAELDPSALLFNAIYLKASTDYDGRLEVREIYELDLRSAQLVVLSGCDTGSGGDGENFALLNRAFFAAGAQRVISSLWSIDDAATTDLLTEFYKARSSGQYKTDSQALQAAMFKLKSLPHYSNPYYWASFVLTGLP
ncbi:MAG: CHAT domain-containing protein [Anaerolineaceae bacterium]|nr:CHAT domain-containing protein [Anaerolineaceae bacterium]